MTLAQDADAIIAEENLDNSQSAVEEPVANNDDRGDQPPADPPQDPPADDTKDDTPPADPPADDKKDDDVKEDDKPADDVKEDKPTPVQTPEPQVPQSPEQSQQEAQTLLQTLQLTDDKIFDAEGNVRPFEEVFKAGEFLNSRIQPVEVTDKDGNKHEFYTLDDVKEKFPDGFEAKNNIEQMEFQTKIMENERNFRDSIQTYKNATELYKKETTALVEARSENERIGSEYKAMAEQGLVPKVEGDPNDPKFLESAAVKELNNILNWMDEKNKELRGKGLGTINSLYVAKQLMDNDGAKSDKQDKAKAVVDERKQVASLTQSGAPSADTPKKVQSNVPLSRLADEIIQQEGLK